MAALKLFLFGALQVEQAGRTLHIQRRKASALLAYLALNDDAHTRAKLATLLWSERDHSHAHGSLRRHLSELNALLGDDWLEVTPDEVRFLHPDGLWIDVVAFQQLLDTCQQHGHPATAACAGCIEPLTAAVQLYRGDFLNGFSLTDAPGFDEWQYFQAETLRQHYATALDRLVQAFLAQDEPTSALPYARLRLNSDPLHEPAHCQLMQIYAATGQHAAAARQYELCKQTLLNELGALPAAETTAIYQELRRRNVSIAPMESRRAHVLPNGARTNLRLRATPFVGRVRDTGNADRNVSGPGATPNYRCRARRHWQDQIGIGSGRELSGKYSL